MEITEQDLEQINMGLERLGLVEVNTIDTNEEEIEVSVKSQDLDNLESDEAEKVVEQSVGDVVEGGVTLDRSYQPVHRSHDEEYGRNGDYYSRKFVVELL